MADQSTALVVRDGTATPSARQLGCTVDGTGIYYPIHNLRADGVTVGVAAPLPVTINPDLPVTSVTSAALEASRILKSSPGRILSLHLNATSSGWFLLFDSIGVPPDGTVTPKKAWQFQASAPATIDIRFDPPLVMVNGATLAFSSTGPFTKSALAAAMFSGEVIELGATVIVTPPPADLAVLTAILSSIPTSLPSTAGVLWNDGGVLSIS